MKQVHGDAGRDMTADEVIALLGLEPLAGEGGFYRETYRSCDAAGRARATAIYYLLTPDTFSAMHRLPADELFHFYAGDPVLMLQLGPDGSATELVLGADLKNGQRPLALVPAGTWQGARLVRGGRWALLGTTMAPGFERAALEIAERDALLARYPQAHALIQELTS